MASTPKDAADRLGAAIAASLDKALPRGGPVAVGYSGGIDSTSLLLLALRHAGRRFKVGAIHVNHNLHPQADAWVAHCRRRCAAHGIPLAVASVRLGRARTAVEARARAARMRVFSRAGQQAVLLAHHADDQAETCLLRALRGSGIRGLAAMREIAAIPDGDGTLVRPWLGFRQADIKLAARHLRIRAIADSSNRDTRHNRNWLRHELLPQAQRRLPGPVEALAQLADNAGQAAVLLDDLAGIDDAGCRIEGGLDWAGLAALGQPRVRNWLSWSLGRQGEQAPHAAHLAEAARQICQARSRLRLDFGATRLAGAAGVLSWRQRAFD